MVVKIKVAYMCSLFDDDKKGKNIYIDDCSLKILGNIAWIKGKSLSFIHINFRGSSCLLGFVISTRGRLLGIILEFIRQNNER